MTAKELNKAIDTFFSEHKSKDCATYESLIELFEKQLPGKKKYPMTSHNMDTILEEAGHSNTDGWVAVKSLVIHWRSF